MVTSARLAAPLKERSPQRQGSLGMQQRGREGPTNKSSQVKRKLVVEGPGEKRHRSEVKNNRFSSHINSTYFDGDGLRNCHLHPVHPLIDPKSSSNGSVDIIFDEFRLHSASCLLGVHKILCLSKNSPQSGSTPMEGKFAVFAPVEYLFYVLILLL